MEELASGHKSLNVDLISCMEISMCTCKIMYHLSSFPMPFNANLTSVLKQPLSKFQVVIGAGIFALTHSCSDSLYGYEI